MDRRRRVVIQLTEDPFRPDAGQDEFSSFTNGERAERTMKFVREVHGRGAMYGSDCQDAVADLLGDLMHLCHREVLDFEAALESGRMHYESER